MFSNDKVKSPRWLGLHPNFVWKRLVSLQIKECLRTSYVVYNKVGMLRHIGTEGAQLCPAVLVVLEAPSRCNADRGWPDKPSDKDELSVVVHREKPK